MEMMYLIVKLNYASVVIPEKYQFEQCKNLAEEINKTKYEAVCIPAPKFTPKYCNGPKGQEICK